MSPVAWICQSAPGRDEGVTAPATMSCFSPSRVTHSSPSIRKSTPSASGSASGWSLPPPGDTSTMYWEKVSAKPDSGRAMTHSRVLSQNGSRLVTMSRIVPRGSTA